MDATDLQYKLKKRGYRQIDVARMAGCSEAAVSMIVHGKTKSRRIMDLIAGLLGDSVDGIFRPPLAKDYQLNHDVATAKADDLLPQTQRGER